MTTQVGVAGHIIKRPRLTRILDETDARIILLCAPAGYGKTTLAREWVATRTEPVLWYSGGPAMADVAALAVDLAELFGGVDSELVERVRFLASRGEGPRTLAKVLAREAPGEGTLLVVDDYQFAGESSASDSLFRELAELTTCRLLLASRIRPEWTDPRKVVYGEAHVLEQQRLAFTPEEAALLLPRGSSVLETAHGWPAVIGLAAASRPLQPDIGALPPKDLYEFFASDLFANAPPSLQEALLTLACGADASRDIARELLGERYTTVIESALRRGFIVRDEVGWIVIHPLLREFLLRQLEDVERVRRMGLVSRVCDVLASDERWDECLRLLEQFPDEDRLAACLEQALPRLLAIGRTRTVAHWSEVAQRQGFDRPVFTLARAEVDLREGRQAEALALAEIAARRLEGDMAARAHLAAARAAHQLDDTCATSDNAERAEALARTADLKREALWLALMNAYERAPHRTMEYLDRFRALDDPHPEHALRLACAAAFILVAEDGKATEALRSAEAAFALESQVRDPLLRTNAHHIRSHLLRVCAYYDEALEAADALLKLAYDSGLEFVVDHALLTKAGALVGLRSFARAREVFRQLDRRSASMSEHVRRNTAMQKAKMRIATGNLEAARVELSEAAPEKPLALRAEYLSLIALVAAAEGRLGEALDAIGCAEGTTGYDEVPSYVLLARALVALYKDSDDAESAATAVSECIRAGTADAVVVACRAVPRLAMLAVRGGAGVDLEALFARSRDADLGRRAGLAMPRELRRRVGLSRREREVYELLIEGRTNIEIAQTLYISPSTAKVHIRHIYEKLGVHSRAEAAAVPLDEKFPEGEV